MMRADTSTSQSVRACPSDDVVETRVGSLPYCASVVVHAEIGFQELYRLTANVSRPNELTTAFASNVLRDLVPHCGAYASLLTVLGAELTLSVYSRASSPPLPFFTLVKHEKKLALALRRDKCVACR